MKTEDYLAATALAFMCAGIAALVFTLLTLYVKGPDPYGPEHCAMPACQRGGHAHCDNARWNHEHP